MLDKLQQFQPFAYQTLANALKDNRLSHAYMFEGNEGSLQKEMAQYYFQHLVCEYQKACGACHNCQAIAAKEYVDLIILDGNESSIKKEDILSLQEQFSKTALEASGKKLFLIDKAEAMTLSAMNALLKFLEEPPRDVYGVLISYDSDRLLATIKSRTQIINFKDLPFSFLYDEAIQKKEELDAYLFASVLRDIELLDHFDQLETYLFAKDCFVQFIEEYRYDADFALLKIHQTLFSNKKLNDKGQAFMLFLDFLILFYRDTLTKSSAKDHWYQSMINQYQGRMENAHELQIIIETKRKINPSINLPLLCDQMIYLMKEEYHEPAI